MTLHDSGRLDGWRQSAAMPQPMLGTLGLPFAQPPATLRCYVVSVAEAE